MKFLDATRLVFARSSAPAQRYLKVFCRCPSCPARVDCAGRAGHGYLLPPSSTWIMCGRAMLVQWPRCLPRRWSRGLCAGWSPLPPGPAVCRDCNATPTKASTRPLTPPREPADRVSVGRYRRFQSVPCRFDLFRVVMGGRENGGLSPYGGTTRGDRPGRPGPATGAAAARPRPRPG